jgi:hypothetical protein
MRVALIVAGWLTVAASACAVHPRISGVGGSDCITVTVEQPYTHGRPESYVLVRPRRKPASALP